MPEHDIRDEERCVGKGEQESQGFAFDPDIRQEVHAADRKPERDQVPPAPHAQSGEAERAEKLDSPDRAEREPLDGQIEERVHGGEDDAELDQRDPGTSTHRSKQAPGPSPRCEDGRGAGDAQPRHAQDVDPAEEKSGECGPEVMEDRAHKKEDVRRDAVRPPDGSAVRRGLCFGHEIRISGTIGRTKVGF
jgi:hypothetical protein